jgi:hypothetical protein
MGVRSPDVAGGADGVAGGDERALTEAPGAHDEPLRPSRLGVDEEAIELADGGARQVVDLVTDPRASLLGVRAAHFG